jgi:hypothetical protein
MHQLNKKEVLMSGGSRDVNKRYIGIWVDKNFKLKYQLLAKEKGVAMTDLIYEAMKEYLKKIDLDSTNK